MIQEPFNREYREYAYLAIAQVLHELLREKKIDAQEFLSIVGHFPVQITHLHNR